MSCLDENALQALAGGTLGARELASAHQHLDVCPLCRRLAAAVAAGGSTGSQAVSTEPQALPGASEAWGRAAYSLRRYFIIESLGQGGMGQVLLAYDAKLDRKVALKRVRTREARLPLDAQALLLREAQAMARLSHPNVLTVHDAAEIDGEVIIAMEYVKGRTLRHWLQEPRSWREVLAMFRAAGKGLAAAHRAGLIHRDFKPDNVLVGEDGRVRVTDFGLARPDEAPELAKDLAPEGAPNSATVRTDAGALSGTPGYIAPEALQRQRGPLSDQFSFFVSLYEALYGERPFEGSSAGAQLKAASQGQVRAAPPGRGVPKWLRRLVLIGLSKDPGQRFPSMAVALDALTRASQRSRRRSRRVAAVAGFAALGAAMAWAVGRPARLCAGEERQLAGIWDEAAKQRLRAAFLSTALPEAEAALQETSRALDAWAGAWVSMRTKACVATRVAGEQSVEVLNQRMACLDRRSMDFESLVRRLSTAGEVPVGEAVKGAAGLPGLFECVNPSSLAAQAVPERGAARERFDELRRDLARARSLQLVRAVEPGLRLAQEVEQKAKVLQLDGLRAEALLVVARLDDAAGDYLKAQESQLEALHLAQAQGQDVLVAEACIGLVESVGARQYRFDEAHRWEKLAQASIARAGLAGQEQEATFFNSAGSVALHEREYERSYDLYKKALALRERLHGKEHVWVADTLSNLAWTCNGLARREEALEHARRALAIREKLLGPSHRDVAVSLHGLATILRETGQVKEGLALSERAVALDERTLPSAHPFLAASLNDLAVARISAGDVHGARKAVEDALAIKRKRLGEDHPDIGSSLLNLAGIEVLGGDYRRAIELGEEIVRRFPAEKAGALRYQGEAHRRAGDLGEAQRSFKLALETLSAKPDEDVEAMVLTGLAECELSRGLRAEARGRLERALEIGEKSRFPPQDLAQTRFALARALPAAQTDRARALAREARAWFETTGRQAERAQADRFLAGL